MSGLIQKAFLIFSGYNQRAVVAFCREATRLRVPFCILANSDEDTILKTSYKDHVYAIRSEKLLIKADLDACIVKTKAATNFTDFVILPSSEFLVRFFLENRAYYQRLNCTIPLVSSELYAKISDKYSFGKLCEANGLLLPMEFENPENLSFPFVAKPRLYFSNNNARTLNPFLILSERDWNDFLQKEDTGAFYYQEFIDGSCYYLLCYLSLTQKDVCYSQKNLVQQAGGKSMIVAQSSDIHHLPIAHKYVGMLKKEGFEGLIMIELKKKGDEFVMIEANPRLWGPSQLFVDAGVPIFEAFIQDQGFEIHTSGRSEIKESMYFWHGGIVEDRKNGKEIAYHEYTPELLDENLEQLLACEVYLREDTKEIFYNESKGLC
ncbi:MAG: hypothetical protein NTY32_02180 [Bacteroidia bacterium]|nr:hypothetical protein [Bacteroidia bacterium]